VGVASGRAGLDLPVLAALLPRVVALGAGAPRVALRDRLAPLVAEGHVVDLLHRAPREARLVLDQLLEERLGRDLVVAPHRLVPGPVRPRPHRVDPGEPAHVAGDDAARGEEERRQRDDPAVAGARRVGRVAPERVVVADAVRVVADVVAGGLVAPGLEGVGDRHPDPPAQVVEALLGDLGEQLGGLWWHGSLLGRGDGGAGLALPQHLAVHLAGRRLGQLGHELDLARVLVLSQPGARPLLQLAHARLGPPPRAPA